MKIVIYGHGGSQNHGNEAIVRGVSRLYNEKIRLFSSYPKCDKEWGLNKKVNISSFIINPNGKRYLRLRKNYEKGTIAREEYFNVFFAPFIRKIKRKNIYLIEAGDQYNEPGEHREFYAFLNKKIHEKGAKSIMLGCTIDKEIMNELDVLDDLKTYDCIIARESLTYEALKIKGLNNIRLLPDPAFAMKSEKADVPTFFGDSDVIGINIGFLAQAYSSYYDILMLNCIKVIEYLISNTNYKVALIPHVNWGPGGRDFDDLEILYNRFKESNNIYIVDEHNAPEQKYIMAKCKVMIALRTHATIASLGEFVPTIACGYKTKTKGIYRDIFGEESVLLADIQMLQNDSVLLDKMLYVLSNYDMIKNEVDEKMEVYLAKLEEYKDVFDKNNLKMM